LVSEGALPHTALMYRRLSAQLAKARREGRFSDLIDTVREVHVPPAWTGADAFVAERPSWFRLDRTKGQEHALYVAAEKDTLRQQLTGRLADAGIPVLVVRGFDSQSYADVVHDRVTADPRDAVLLVVGDFDCSGEDIERDWVARTGCWSHTERVLLKYEQVRAYELPATEGKRGDPRWPASPAATASTPAAQCSGRWRRWSRPNSAAWCSPPSTRTSTPTSSPGRSPARKSNAAPWPPLREGG
jgi:hypothetical protein